MNILKVIKELNSSFPPLSPPFWAPEGHLQTILASLLPQNPLPPIDEVHLLPLENPEEQLHVSYIKGHTETCLYLFHGLGGSIESPYMKRFAHLAKKLGHHVYLANHRGCGEGKGLARSGYNSGRSEDLSRVIAFGRSRHHQHFHIACGVSLSANALLLLSAGVRATALPDLAIAVNAPINLELSGIKLKSGLNRIYDRHFLRSLKNYLLHNSDSENLKDYFLLESLHDFDNHFTAPVAGYKDREEYYRTCSAKQFLNQIKVPTLLITSADDPFIDVSEYKSARFSSSTILRIEETGGHVGYLQGQGLGYRYWLDDLLTEVLKTKWAQ